MFFTQSAAERFPPGPTGEPIQYWGVVERDLETPWFHLYLEVQEDGLAFGHTLLVADAAQLDLLLGQLAGDCSVRSLMLVTPPSMNRSQHWRMERVVRLHVSLNESSTGNLFCIDLDCGKRYTVRGLYLLQEKPFQSRCIYEDIPAT
ncbi:hypothetical protein [Pseudomonas sp. NPDC089741]|uniref:hypothetical protein n=1 Tax=Pseudomonas sp. NPDC089741 TaxID=3364470 RepID=UPI0038279575